ncbi:YbaB/EbfC family nucleoid-associated protein [bacterium]|nr:YbaB/EbfC family nucleoid-associated protein [bacterium]
MNLMNMMKQVQNIQKKATAMKEELANLEITGESAGGAVKVVCSGEGKFKSIKISPEAINPENPGSVDSDMLETLEDIISSAMNDANNKADREMQEKMKQVTGGLKIPGLSF